MDTSPTRTLRWNGNIGGNQLRPSVDSAAAFLSRRSNTRSSIGCSTTRARRGSTNSPAASHAIQYFLSRKPHLSARLRDEEEGIFSRSLTPGVDLGVLTRSGLNTTLPLSECVTVDSLSNRQKKCVWSLSVPHCCNAPAILAIHFRCGMNPTRIAPALPLRAGSHHRWCEPQRCALSTTEARKQHLTLLLRVRHHEFRFALPNITNDPKPS